MWKNLMAYILQSSEMLIWVTCRSHLYLRIIQKILWTKWKGLKKPLTSDYTTWKRTHTHTHPTTLFLRTAPDTRRWHSHVVCVISDSSSVSTASVFGCCMNEVSWGKWYFVSVRCLLIVGSLMWTEVFWTQKPRGGETTCDNTGNLDYRCAQRARERQQLQKHLFLLGWKRASF